MSGELVKRGAGAVSREKKIASVLARIENRAGETVDVLKVCAVHDKPFLVAYRREADGLFHVAAVNKLRNETAGGVSSRNAAPVTLRPDDIAGPGPDCPWCGVKPVRWKGRAVTGVECGSCASLVCVGRTFDGFFRCRDSCGGSGDLGAWVDTQGTKRKDANAQPAGAGRASYDTKPANGRPSPRMLTDGRK